MLNPLIENFQLIIAEVEKQLQDTRLCLQAQNVITDEKVHLRDDYVDNMKGIIQNRSFRLMLEHPEMTKPQVDTVRAIGIATHNLENIADFCTHVVDQTHFLGDLSFLADFELPLFFQEILEVLPLILPAIVDKKANLALRICRAEFRLDDLYKKHFDSIMGRLENGGEVRNLITSLFIIRYLERTGDCLLNIGEAALSCILGEKFKIHQYTALDQVTGGHDGLHADGSSIPERMDASNPDAVLALDYQTIAETRSGCRIARIRNPGKRGAGNWTLYKEGPIHKVIQEKENLEKWDTLIPGLVPRVIGYQEVEDHAQILLEYLEGMTFQELLLGEGDQYLQALEAMQQLLLSVWSQTRTDDPVPSGFMEQLSGRLSDIIRLHPEFDTPESTIGPVTIRSFSSRIRRLAELEQGILAAFRVFIHGDFNNDNVIIRPGEGTIHLIDVNRSRMGDYLQDITVFLLSNARLPVFESRIRRRIAEVNRSMYRFAADFAAQNGDHSFGLRCSLGLIRSFLTSTRFVAKDSFATGLYHRAMYLADRILESDGRNMAFSFPEEILD